METSDFDYNLPQELIAQTPLEQRDRSRLMVLHRNEGKIDHRLFTDISSFLEKGDTLVFNDSRVIPARLYGFRTDDGAGIELLLLRRWENCLWETLARPGKKLKKGTKIVLKRNSHEGETHLGAEVTAQKEGGIRLVRFESEDSLEELGEMPLPPYIHTPLPDWERYQTIYSRIKGSVAAPTAGLHFTPRLLGKLEEKGVNFVFVTLHIGLDTFQPVRSENPSDHVIHTERGELSEKAASMINEAKEDGKKVIGVGTSTIRIVEAASYSGKVAAFHGDVDLFILPGYKFHTIDAMLTNFHLPRSTLIMMVSAFAGEKLIRQAYEQAIQERYRFYSFGDAMLIL
jgi:S-adenosylmethionine:tRNA ribosyltransferase-isomerase